MCASPHTTPKGLQALLPPQPVCPLSQALHPRPPQPLPQALVSALVPSGVCSPAGGRAGVRPGHAQSAQVRAAAKAAAAGEEEEGAAAAAAAVRSGPGGAAQSSCSCARTAARPSPQVIGSPASAAQPPAARSPLRPPAVVAGSRTHIPGTPTPDVNAGSQPLTPQHDPQSLASVSSAKPQGWKMWQPATERLQVRGTREAGGQPGGGAWLEEQRGRFCPKRSCKMHGWQCDIVALNPEPGTRRGSGDCEIGERKAASLTTFGLAVFV